jgi:hypothetical protein
MFVYPVNAIEASIMSSPQKSTYSLGNTNATEGNLKFYNDNNLLYEVNLIIEDYLTIINTNIFKIDKFVLTLKGNENITIGYLFSGIKWELPRFLTLPVDSLELRNESDRTISGQITGIPTETLKSFSAKYTRITNEQKKIFDDYINGVQTVIPHVIDPYPLAHEQFEPFFGTVFSYGDATKREENGFFWNFNCSWREAK